MDLAAFGSQVPTISCWEKRKTGLIEIEMQIHDDTCISINRHYHVVGYRYSISSYIYVYSIYIYMYVCLLGI